MTTIKSELIRPFDVDGCLIVDSDKSSEIAHVYDGVTQRLLKVGVNKAMVRLLKEEHHRGSFIIVWSRSGYEWASAVVNALGLKDSVDLVMSKPTVYFDD